MTRIGRVTAVYPFSGATRDSPCFRLVVENGRAVLGCWRIIGTEEHTFQGCWKDYHTTLTIFERIS